LPQRNLKGVGEFAPPDKETDSKTPAPQFPVPAG
jgi:hypothetical protein